VCGCVRLRLRKGERARGEEEVARAKESVKEARRELKVFRRIEKEWWKDRLEECREVCEKRDVCKMLKELGKREERSSNWKYNSGYLNTKNITC